ncbi:thioredoxin TrxC [Aliikangiella sp. G2MR2-5]|uniref:thioredoxin TrxC n=1 Tax=Aliikangiella sp. G2MR2-5 TaxID=2788943 RepID=UPI001AEF2BA2
MKNIDDKIRLVCGQCNTVNQFPASRLDETPICAQCKEKLFQGVPINVNAEGLARHLRHSGLPVLVDFWAPWCGPCIQFAPAYEKFASLVGNQLRLLKVDTQQNQQVSVDFNIRSIPTLALFRGGREIGRLSGALPLPQLQQWVIEQLTNN